MRFKWFRISIGVICGLHAGVLLVQTSLAQSVAGTGTLTQKVTIDLTGQAGSATGTIDPFGNVSATTGNGVANITVLNNPLAGGDSFQVDIPTTNNCTATGTIIGGTGVFANSSGTVNLTGSPCLIPSDLNAFRITGAGSIVLSLTIDSSCGGGSGETAQTLCENQEASVDPPIIGTPFELHYQSSRIPGRSGASVFLTSFAGDLGGWTLNVRHAYDPVSGNLYLGSGGRRRASVLGAPPIVGGNYLVTNEQGSEVYVFDHMGRHLFTRDALTGAIAYTFGYDGAGRLKTITDSSGNVTSFARDTIGNLTAITGPYGQKTSVSVNSSGYITQITNPNQESFNFNYSAGGLLVSMTDPMGNIDKFQYDSQGLLTHADHAGGSSEDLVRNSDGTIQLTSAAGVATNFATDLSTRGTERRTIKYATGLVGSAQSSSNSSSANMPNGTVYQSSFGPDPRWGIQTPITVASTVTLPSGLQFVASETRSVKASNSADPFSINSITDVITINGNQVQSIYDGSSRTLTATMAGGLTASQNFDVNGRTTRQQIGNLDPTSLSYDSHGRLSSISAGSDSRARTTSFSYNSQGYVSAVTDAIGRVFGLEYDGAGRVTKHTLPQGAVIGYKYDASGHLTTVTPPGSGPHTFTYGASGRLTKYSPPPIPGVSAETSYQYNPDGRVKQITLGGQTINFIDDNAGRLSSIALPTGTISYAYDAKAGVLASISGPGPVGLNLVYDGPLLTQETWTGMVSGSVKSTYNQSFFVTARSINDVATINYTLDPDGVPSQAGSMSISHDPNTGLATGSAIDNFSDAHMYDLVGQEIGYSANVNGSPVYSVQFSYDQLGRITQAAETIQGDSFTRSYTYDAIGRLASASLNDATNTYSYDANGNRLSVSGVAASTGVYDAQDRTVSYGNLAYTYRDDGQLLSSSDGQVSTQYQSDAFGNLLGVTLPDGTQVNYLLDGNNRRIAKQINGSTVHAWIYEDNLRPVAELDGSNNVVSIFVYAGPTGAPAYMIKNGINYRIVSDERGSPRLVVDTVAGAVAQRLDYDEFGRVLADNNPGFQPFGFAGGLYDADTGLVHFGARDYDPFTGRWLGKDPARFGGRDTNLYAYAAEDPVNQVDPTGLCPSWQDIRDGVKNWINNRFSKVSVEAVTVDFNEGTVSVGGSVSVQAFGNDAVSVDGEAGVGIDKSADPTKLGRLYLKIGAKIPALTKLPIIGHFFGGSKTASAEVSLAPWLVETLTRDKTPESLCSAHGYGPNCGEDR